MLPGTSPWAQHPLSHAQLPGQTAPSLCPDFCSSAALASKYPKDLQAGQVLSLWKSTSISGMLLAEGEEPYPFPTVEEQEVKHDLMGFPQLCGQMSQSQVLPSHIQPQHCLSGPQKGQAEVRFCSSLPTRQSFFCDLNEINCTIILPRTVILLTHPSSERLHLLSSCGALGGRDF